MKQLTQYIKESEEADYMLWQLDQWFKTYQNDKQDLMNIILQCMKDKSVNNVEKYLNQTCCLINNYKEFVTFMLDDVKMTNNNEIDYIYNLKKIIQQLISNKSPKNTYIIAI